MRKILLILLIFWLIFLALIPRITEILSGNYLFGFDQGRDYLAVKDIVVNHKLTLIGSEIGAGFAGFRGIFHGPFHYYFLAIPFLLFRGNPYGGIILTFTYGLLAVILSFYLGRKLFGPIWGLIAALLVAISPPLISQSRFVWNTHGAAVFIPLAFYFVYRRRLFLAAFFSGFIYNFQLGIAIPMCLTLFIFCLFFLRLKKLKEYVSLFGGFILAFLPMILFELRHGLVIKGLKDYLFNPGETAVTLKFVELNLKDHLKIFIYNFYDTFPRLNLPGGDIPALIFVILVIFFLFKEKNINLKQFLIYLLLLPVFNFFVFSFLRGAVYIYYLLDLNFVYILLFSYIFYSASRNKNHLLKLGLAAFYIFLLIKASVSAVNVFKYDYYDYGGIAKIKGKIQALDDIYKDAGGKPFNLLVFTPPVYTYAYDYLFWWHGKGEYGYEPGRKKEGTLYLLIEPDPHQPWTYKGWLETAIKNGKIIETKELPSGFIIEKRYQGTKL